MPFVSCHAWMPRGDSHWIFPILSSQSERASLLIVLMRDIRHRSYRTTQYWTIHHFTNANFCQIHSLVGAKCDVYELIFDKVMTFFPNMEMDPAKICISKTVYWTNYTTFQLTEPFVQTPPSQLLAVWRVSSSFALFVSWAFHSVQPGVWEPLKIQDENALKICSNQNLTFSFQFQKYLLTYLLIYLFKQACPIQLLLV